jgi:transcriptional regulator with XRE-family HTH domain
MLCTVMAKSLGELIREAMKSSGLTQKQLANALHVRRQYIGRLEGGEDHDLSTAQRKRFAEAPHIPVTKYWTLMI